MRLQLIILFLLCAFPGLGQYSDSSATKITDDIDVNFLLSYYDQDGIHSAVTGGLGTERLKDYASVLVVNVPLDSSKTLTVSGGLTYYTSASNDKIDFRVSSASREEFRGDLDVILSKYHAASGITRKFQFGASLDVDYLSTSVGYGWSKLWPSLDRQLSLNGKFYFDTWVWLIYPVELRGTERAQVPTNKRFTYNLNIDYAWTINKRLQAALIAEPTYQHGLLSTPFHRVFLADTLGTFLEKLPSNRFKLPLAIRLHYFATDNLILRFYYRYFVDSWGIEAHTANLELPVKFGTSFTVFPFYRYHTQTATDYFAPYQQHRFGQRYITSDFDLSDLHSHRYGLGLRFTPLEGIARFKWSKRKYTEFKGLEIRYANYQREDGLKAWSISANSSFVIR